MTQELELSLSLSLFTSDATFVFIGFEARIYDGAPSHLLRCCTVMTVDVTE